MKDHRFVSVVLVSAASGTIASFFPPSSASERAAGPAW
jgi:hypothetical protein